MSSIGDFVSSVSRIGSGFIPGFLPNSQWRDENFDPLAENTPGNNDAPTKLNLPGTGLFVAGFVNGAAITEVLASGKELNHDWDVGTLIGPHYHLIKMDSGSGSVVFGFEYRIIRGSEIVNGTLSVVHDVSALTPYVENEAKELGEIDMSGFTDVGPQVTFRLFRDPIDAADTFAGDVGIQTFGWHYLASSTGSRSRFAK